MRKRRRSLTTILTAPPLPRKRSKTLNYLTACGRIARHGTMDAAHIEGAEMDVKAVKDALNTHVKLKGSDADYLFTGYIFRKGKKGHCNFKGNA